MADALKRPATESELLREINEKDPKALQALERAREEVVGGTAKQVSKDPGIVKFEESNQIIPLGLGKESPGFAQSVSGDSTGDIHKKILQRALEILQGDAPVDDAHGLTEALMQGQSPEAK